MVAPDTRPRLRWPLDVRHIRHEGKDYSLLTDTLGIAPAPAVIPGPLMVVVARFDGERTVGEIAEEGAPYGLTIDIVVRLVTDLADMFFLDTPESRARAQTVREEFRASSEREAAFAGVVYPAAPDELRRVIDGYIAASDSEERISGQPAAMICPHIDYRRGWRTYGAAFSALREMKKPDIVVLIGTSHQPGTTYFQLSDKGFQSPFGVMPAAKDAVHALANHYGPGRSFRDEILHRREHSLELQIPFLAHCFQNDGIPAIVPILVGSFHPFLLQGKQPQEEPEVGDFISGLALMLKELQLSGRSVLLYGGIDLAHVGQHFGDADRLTPEALAQIELRDRQLLDCVLRADEVALFQHIASDVDRRRICGFPSLYVMLSAMRQAGRSLQGRLIEYRQAYEPDSDCAVTFASAAWFDI